MVRNALGLACFGPGIHPWVGCWQPAETALADLSGSSEYIVLLLDEATAAVPEEHEPTPTAVNFQEINFFPPPAFSKSFLFCHW